MHTQADVEFEPVVGWETLPQGYVHKDVTDVAIDSEDNVYLLTRFDSRVIVYDRSGNFLRSWGEDIISEGPHGLAVGPDDHVYVADQYDHTVQKFTREGERVAVLGTSGVPSDSGYVHKGGNFKARVATIERGAGPFNHPTSVAIAPEGDIFVTDGYGNSRVHHFRGDGTLVKSWGTPGIGPGEFHVPHGIALDHQGRLLVVDRENDRIQLFSQDGDYLEEWTDLHKPSGIAVDGEGLVFVSEMPRHVGDWSWVHGTIESNLPPRVSILDGESGEAIHRLGLGSEEDPCAPGNFAAAHGVAVDSHGDLYVSEVTYSLYVVRGPWNGKDYGTYVGEDCHTFQKLVRRGRS